MIITSQRLNLIPPSDLKVEAYILRAHDGDNHEGSEKILLMSYSGTYPLADAGAKHGRFIASSTVQALVTMEPFGLVLDFRELEYSWGEALFEVYVAIEQFMEAGREPPDRDRPHAPAVSFPVATVTSDKSRDGIRRLLDKQAASLSEDNFDDVNKAVEAIAERTVDWGMCSWRSIWERGLAAGKGDG